MPVNGIQCISDRLRPTSVGGFAMTREEWGEVHDGHEHMAQLHTPTIRGDRLDDSAWLQVTAPSAGAMERVCWSWGAEQAQDFVPRSYIGAVGRCCERDESGERQFSNGSGFLHARPLRQRHRHSDHTSTSTSPQPTIKSLLPRHRRACQSGGRRALRFIPRCNTVSRFDVTHRPTVAVTRDKTTVARSAFGGKHPK